MQVHGGTDGRRRPHRPRAAGGELLQHALRVGPLHVDAIPLQGPNQRGTVVGALADERRQGAEVAVVERAAFGGRDQAASQLLIQLSARHGRTDGVAEVHEGFGDRPVAVLGVEMEHRHLVVAVQLAPRVEVMDDPQTPHPVRRELCRPQGAHAGAAEHLHPGLHRRQDLLVPDGPHGAHEAVDHEHAIAGREVESEEVPRADRWPRLARRAQLANR